MNQTDTPDHPGAVGEISRRGRLRTLPAALVVGGCAAVLVVLSLIPVPSAAYGLGSLKAHAIAYGAPVIVFFALFSGALARVAVSLGLWLLGAALEVAQSFTGWRSGSLEDVAYNTLGIAAAAIAYLGIEQAVRFVRRLVSRATPGHRPGDGAG